MSASGRLIVPVGRLCAGVWCLKKTQSCQPGRNQKIFHPLQKLQPRSFENRFSFQNYRVANPVVYVNIQVLESGASCKSSCTSSCMSEEVVLHARPWWSVEHPANGQRRWSFVHILGRDEACGGKGMTMEGELKVDDDERRGRDNR